MWYFEITFENKVSYTPQYHMIVYILHEVSLCLNFFHLLGRKPNLEKKNSIHSNKFFYNFPLSQSNFTCPNPVLLVPIQYYLSQSSFTCPNPVLLFPIQFYLSQASGEWVSLKTVKDLTAVIYFMHYIYVNYLVIVLVLFN